jgi:hypothetical protein
MRYKHLRAGVALARAGVGIPAGGVGVVSPDLAGQYDPCYHLACDTYPSNINNKVLDIMSDSVAHTTLTFAQTTSAVNGTDNGSSSSTKSYEWKGPHRIK